MCVEFVPTIIICGATASGKTEISLKLTNYFDLEIISADSRQIYKYLDIGTAKPTIKELDTVKHHFINMLQPDENYSAGKFGNDAYSVLMDIHQRGKISVIVGGSGLYLKSLIEGFFENNSNEIDNSIRKKLEIKLKKKGINALYNELKIIDPVLYKLYSEKNPTRIIRALQHYKQYGRRLSDDWKYKQNRTNIVPFYFCIDEKREILYNRINERVIKMWDMGLVKETENILKMGYNTNLNSLNTVGYKETISFLNGIFSKEKAIEEIQKNTRHYAKRQNTWFKKVQNIMFFEKKDIIKEITNVFKKRIATQT